MILDEEEVLRFILNKGVTSEKLDKHFMRKGYSTHQIDKVKNELLRKRKIERNKIDGKICYY